jgi:hypothetical protein
LKETLFIIPLSSGLYSFLLKSLTQPMFL